VSEVSLVRDEPLAEVTPLTPPPEALVAAAEIPEIPDAEEASELPLADKLPLLGRPVGVERGETEDDTDLSKLGGREQPYAIASLCEAQRSASLLSASGGGGVAAPPSGLAISRTSLADLGEMDVDATILGSSETAAGPRALPSAPIPKAEATAWQRGAEGQVRLVALSRVLPGSRVAIRCDA